MAPSNSSGKAPVRRFLFLLLSVFMLLTCSCQPSSPPASHQPRSIVVSSVADQVFVLDGQDGHLLWSHADVLVSWIPQISGNLIYLINTHATLLTAVDALTGRSRWMFQGGLAGFTSGTAYTFDPQDDLVALRSADGKPLWKIANTPQSEMRLFVAGDTPYLWQTDAGNPDQGRVAALSPATGAVRWQTPIANFIGEVGDAHDGLVFAFGGTSAGPTFYALDAASGELRWQVFSPLNTPHIIQVLPCGSNTLCLGYSDGSITAVNSQDGTARWHFTSGAPVPSGGFFTPLTFAQDGDSVLVATPQHLAVVAVQSGVLRWQRDFVSSAALSLSGAYPFQQGIIYINTQNKKVYGGKSLIEAIDATTGTIKWQAPGTDSAAGCPLLLGDKLINAPGTTLIAYHITDGSIDWQAALPHLSSPLKVEFLSVATVPA